MWSEQVLDNFNCENQRLVRRGKNKVNFCCTQTRNNALPSKSAGSVNSELMVYIYKSIASKNHFFLCISSVSKESYSFCSQRQTRTTLYSSAWNTIWYIGVATGKYIFHSSGQAVFIASYFVMAKKRGTCCSQLTRSDCQLLLPTCQPDCPQQESSLNFQFLKCQHGARVHLCALCTAFWSTSLCWIFFQIV